MSTTTNARPAARPAARPDRIISIFRIIAIAEAVSWGGLLVAMIFKYALVENEAGVRIMGPIHGAVFLAYLVVTLVVGMRCKWSPKLILLGLFAAVPPFATVAFEMWASRSGHLRAPETGIRVEAEPAT